MEKVLGAILYGCAVLIRIGSIYFVIKWPLVGWAIIFLVDTIDYFFAIHAGLTFKRYQYIDKSLDLLNDLYLVIGAFVIGLPYFFIYIVLFIIRIIGEVLYLKTRSDKFLVMFPNVIEFFFPLQILLSTWNPIFVLASALGIKMAHEYLLHVKHWVDPISRAYIRNHPEHERKI